jgi:hypothetical protein
VDHKEYTLDDFLDLGLPLITREGIISSDGDFCLSTHSWETYGKDLSRVVVEHALSKTIYTVLETQGEGPYKVVKGFFLVNSLVYFIVDQENKE